MGLAVLAEIAPVGVDDGGGVVVVAGVFPLEQGYDDDHPGLLRQLDHLRYGRTIGHRLGRGEMFVLLLVAEVGGVEDLLEAQDLGALLGGLTREVDVLVDH